MKKLFITMVALASFAACQKSEVVNQVEPQAIGFSNVFVDNSTRAVTDPSFTMSNLFSDFAVYGFVEKAVLFDGTTVSQTITNGDLSSAWKYEGTQYWIAGANYDFYAIAPKTDGNWEKASASSTSANVNFTNEDGTTDLLAAYVAQQGAAEQNAKVAFTFNHLLSKVKFSFENDYNATNATIRVKDIKITNAYKTGTASYSNESAIRWANHQPGSNWTLNFGMATDNEATTDKENVEVAYAFGKTYESQKELLLIPGAVTNGYNITFKVELLVSGTVVKEYTHNVKADFAPEAGKSYDIKAVITAENIDPDHAQEPIEFTVSEINGWGNTNNETAE